MSRSELEGFMEAQAPLLYPPQISVKSPEKKWKLTVAPDGRMLIPQALRELLRLGPGGKVMARFVEGRLELMTPESVMATVRAELALKVPPEVSMVDEFIEERRKEAARDDAA